MKFLIWIKWPLKNNTKMEYEMEIMKIELFNILKLMFFNS
jgi:hypothetical protein